MKRRFTEDSWRKEPWFRALCAAMLTCKHEEDLGNFLRDVATLSELQAFSERMEVARLLSQGWSYRQIARETGASTTTVTRVAHFLENGEGGYRKVLKAHRHHRMVHTQADLQPRSEMPVNTASPQQGTEQRPVTPLQKYLQKSDVGAH